MAAHTLINNLLFKTIENSVFYWVQTIEQGATKPKIHSTLHQKILLNTSFSVTCNVPLSFQCSVFLLNWMGSYSVAHGVSLTTAWACTGVSKILHLAERPESLPHIESSPQATKHVRPNLIFGAPRPQILKPIYRFRGPESKYFSFCFLPLTMLPKVLHYFWPLMSEFCVVRKSLRHCQKVLIIQMRVRKESKRQTRA